MARVNDVIENPVTGERFVCLQTAQTSNGEVFAFDLYTRPHGFAAAEHIHPRQEETFEVLKGTLRLTINGKRSDARVGEKVVIPPGIRHSWWNESDEEMIARVSFRPALNTETFFETFFGLARDDKTNKRGMPNILQLAVLQSAYRETMQIPFPAPVKKILQGVAFFAHVFGYRASYPKYSSPNVDTMPKVVSGVSFSKERI
jgi:quercetin dioxygenase-like cupin family protein